MYQSNTVKTDVEKLQLSCQNSGKQRLSDWKQECLEYQQAPALFSQTGQWFSAPI